jgi:NADPH:quinone reductase-like Zn-dependent oxidoreductase
MTQHGPYAEYICTSAWNCVPLPNEVSFEQGAGGVVLPLTIVGLLERCQELKAKAVVITAGNS